ncbi:hypothetical protein VTI28DRAFT_10573 [Corynascus sepedonium]
MLTKTSTPSPAAPTHVAAVAPFPGTAFTNAHSNIFLPSPADARRRNEATGHPIANDKNGPPPVRIPELGLIVKYGTQVTRAEVEAQRYVYQQLKGRVPVPEVMGWAEDAGQGFIYMALVDAPILAARWTRLTEPEKQAICEELKGMVQAWRGLKQDPGDVYIGAVGKRSLNDIIVKDRSHLYAPWSGSGAVKAFQEACDIEIKGDIPIVFTHGDLVACNILVARGRIPELRPRYTIIHKLDHDNYSLSWLAYNNAAHVRERDDTEFNSQSYGSIAEAKGMPLSTYFHHAPNGRYLYVVFPLSGATNCFCWGLTQRDRVEMSEGWFVRECARLRAADGNAMPPASVHELTEREMLAILGRPGLVTLHETWACMCRLFV